MEKPAKRVLIVDDEQPLRVLMGEVLVRAGYRVEFAEGGRTAVEKVRSSPPDLMTLDLRMPDMSGWQVIEAVQNLPGAPPIVLVSGSTDIIQERHPLRSCVAGIVYKPFHPRDLVTTCSKVLDDRERERPGVSVVVERRLVPRRDLVMDVGVGSDAGRPMVVGKLAHLSPIGAELRLPGPLNAGQVVRLQLRLPGREGMLAVDGKIQSCDNGNDELVYGISFLNVSPQVQEVLSELVSPSDGRHSKKH